MRLSGTDSVIQAFQFMTTHGDEICKCLKVHIDDHMKKREAAQRARMQMQAVEHVSNAAGVQATGTASQAPLALPAPVPATVSADTRLSPPPLSLQPLSRSCRRSCSGSGRRWRGWSGSGTRPLPSGTGCGAPYRTPRPVCG